MGNNNNRIGSKVAPYVRVGRNGMFTTPGPFIGIVKNNLDPTCSGRLQVYIPQFGASDETNPDNWVTVNYSSPFRGQTKRRIDITTYVDKSIDTTADVNSVTENSFQSYGWWFVPPDINIKVLCQFVNGDPSQGYWTGCIQDPFDSHMVPGLGSSPAQASVATGGYLWNPSLFATHKALQPYIQLSDPKTGAVEIPQRLPTAEAVLSAQAGSTNINNVQMVPLVYQTMQLGIQGLVFDQGRGTTTASDLRENPSQVFGVSTPGRLSVFKDVTTSKALIALMQQYVNDKSSMAVSDQQAVENALSSSYRTGGHQIILDDGTVEGKNQGIRIRSANGNMILMDDTNGQIYIATSTGNAWVELSPSGRVDIFSAADFSIRSKGNINFHSDKDILINAVGSLEMHSGSLLKIDSAADLSLRGDSSLIAFTPNTLQLGSGKTNLSSTGVFSIQSGNELNLNGTTTNINCQAGAIVKDPGVISKNTLIDTGYVPGSLVWWSNGSLSSIVSRAPAHEPWPDHEVNSVVTSAIPTGQVISQQITRSTGTSSGVRNSPLSSTINEAALKNQPIPNGPLCGLTITQSQALLAQIAKTESHNNYTAVNQLNYIGKYQFGAQALEDAGYIKKGAKTSQNTNASVITNSSNWTGLNGCNSQSDWLNNPTAQESAMQSLVSQNCKVLRKIGIINSSSTPEQIGGLLCAAHLVGPGGAAQYWKYLNNQDGTIASDANGTTSATYYNNGVNAIQLGTSVQAANG